jgi:hypothetical protein
MGQTYEKPSLKAALRAIERRWPHVKSPCVDAPIFILASGWRSGSTLLQRLVLPHCFVWGEPYGHSWMIDGMCDGVRAFTDTWPEPHFFYRGEPRDVLAQRFIANLYPEPQDLLAAHLDFFERLFAEPARRHQAARWGIKEVRLSVDHARYLHWLFPRAKTLFLIRNPYDAYRSYAARRDAGWKWFNRWPDRPLTVREFGRHWRQLAEGFLREGQEVGGLAVRYEQLVRREFAAIEQHLGFELSQAAAEANPSDSGPPAEDQIAPSELIELRCEVEPVAEELGYRPNSKEQGIERTVPKGAIAAPSASAADGVIEVSAASIPPWPIASPNDRSRCAVLVPVGSHIEPACDAALRELERRGYRVRRVRGYAAIDQGRSQMATDALKDGFAETMWIDADVGFDADTIDQLRAHGQPIVCGIYPKKGKRELAVHVLPGTESILFGQGGGLVELLYAATGFLLVRGEVYLDMQRRLQLPLCNERFGRPLVPYFQPLVRADGLGHWYLAEDYAFSERARQCGYRILADTTIRLQHFGSYGYTWEDAGGAARRFATYRYHFTAPPKPEEGSPSQPQHQPAGP